jgi:hypothetical protein
VFWVQRGFAKWPIWIFGKDKVKMFFAFSLNAVSSSDHLTSSLMEKLSFIIPLFLKVNPASASGLLKSVSGGKR